MTVTDGMELRVLAALGASIRCPRAPFDAHTGRGAVCRKIGCINHDLFFLAVLGGQAYHDLGKDTFLAPALV